MTAAYNPAEVERLIAEAREDDHQMTPVPWTGGADAVFLADDTALLETQVRERRLEDSRGVARTRNNLAVMADQLEAADAEIVSLRDERDVACTVVDQLRSQNRSLCEALAAAQVKMHAADQRCRTMGEITDEALGLLFGLLTSTGPDRMSINDRRVLIQVAERLQRVQREASK